MAAALSLILFVLLTGAITAFGYSKYVRPSRIIDRLSAAPDHSLSAVDSTRKPRFDAIFRLLGQIGEMLPLSPADLKLTRRSLVLAGIRSDTAVLRFYGMRVIAAFALFGVAFVSRNHMTQNPVLRLVILVAGGAAGYFGPGFVLDRMISRRRERIRFALPDALDLLVVCTEAGCALDQAIVNVSRELGSVHPDLCDELSLVNLSMLAGSPRTEALRGLADRTGEEDIKKLVAILIQTDRFGTSVSDALRTQSDFLRIRRRQEAEERGGKVGVKLVFPIFFFCLPSLLIVTAGPGILQLVKNLLPAMRELH